MIKKESPEGTTDKLIRKHIMLSHLWRFNFIIIIISTILAFLWKL